MNPVLVVVEQIQRHQPLVGFSVTIRKIKARTSLLTGFRPPIGLTLDRLPPPGPEGLQRNPEQLVQSGNRRRGRRACKASNC
jgi:hypothetical protein